MGSMCDQYGQKIRKLANALGNKKKTHIHQISFKAMFNGFREHTPQTHTNQFRRTGKNDTCAWTPNSVFWQILADDGKSWHTGYLHLGQATLGKQATTGNPGFQAIGSGARQV